MQHGSPTKNLLFQYKLHPSQSTRLVEKPTTLNRYWKPIPYSPAIQPQAQHCETEHFWQKIKLNPNPPLIGHGFKHLELTTCLQLPPQTLLTLSTCRATPCHVRQAGASKMLHPGCTILPWDRSIIYRMWRGVTKHCNFLYFSSNYFLLNLKHLLLFVSVMLGACVSCLFG